MNSSKRYLTRLIQLLFTLILFTPIIAFSSLDQLLLSPPLSNPKLSPDGMKVAFEAKDIDGKKNLGVTTISDLKNKSYISRDWKKRPANITSYAWVDNDLIIITSDAKKDASILEIIDLNKGSLGDFRKEGHWSIVDPMPGNSRFVAAVRPEENKFGNCKVVVLDASNPEYEDVLYSTDSKTFEALTDRDNNLRLIKKNVKEDGEEAWFYLNPKSSEWQKLTLGAYTKIFGIDYINTRAIVAGWIDGTAPTLCAYDLLNDKSLQKRPADPKYSFDKYGEVYFSDEKNAMVGMRMDYGQPQMIWFHPDFIKMQKEIDTLLPGSHNKVAGWNSNLETVLVERIILDSPIHYVWLNLATQEVKRIAINGGDVDISKVGVTKMLDIPNREGLPLTCFLTIPREKQKEPFPLVVHIRSNPWDDSEKYEWSCESNYLANRGLAVLRINFRSTAGLLGDFGTKLEKREDFMAIFEDIEDMVKAVSGAEIIDGNKVTIAGSGQGAWIAAYAPIASPRLYKAAICINGIYDFVDYQETEDNKDPLKGIVEFNFANKDSKVSEAVLQEFSPSLNMQNYPADLFVTCGKWSPLTYKKHADAFVAQARKGGAYVSYYKNDWWGNGVNAGYHDVIYREAVKTIKNAIK